MVQKKGVCILIGLLLCLVAVLLVWSSAGEAGKRPIVKSKIVKVVPSPVLKWPDKGFKYAILVDKAAQKTYVIDLLIDDELWKL